MPTVNTIYTRLEAAYGPQHWWPGETPFEVAVGAILTQSVSWKNVETAIAALADGGLLNPRKLYALDAGSIAPLIRSTGYFNQKAKKLRHFLEWFSCHDFSFDRLSRIDALALRGELLRVNGIGPETADSILLYALEKKIFVIDAYTRRIFSRIGLCGGDENYDDLQRMFHKKFRGDVREYNEYHALIVRHGKDVCKKKPLCGACCLAGECAFGKDVSGAAD